MTYLFVNQCHLPTQIQIYYICPLSWPRSSTLDCQLIGGPNRPKKNYIVNFRCHLIGRHRGGSDALGVIFHMFACNRYQPLCQTPNDVFIAMESEHWYAPRRKWTTPHYHERWPLAGHRSCCFRSKGWGRCPCL